MDSRLFLEHFLNNRNLSCPDGRPLYSYKISKHEYQKIKQILKINIINKEWKASFVLYASEYIRYEIEDGHITWNSIIKPLHRKDLTDQQRIYDIVTEGLEYWKRKIFEFQDREFIESLRRESGIPISSLRETTNLSSLFKLVFNWIENYEVELENLQLLIEEHINRYPIPIVLRQENFYNLLIQICKKLFIFKNEYNLGNQKNPLDILNQNNPDWNRQLPIKIDHEIIINFFNDLISEISNTTEIEPLALEFHTNLILEPNRFKLKSILRIKKGIYSYSAFGLSKTEFEKLPPYFILNIYLDGNIIQLCSLNKTNNEKISAIDVNKELPFEILENDWKILYATEDYEIQFSTDIYNFVKIDITSPQIFVEKSNNWIAKGSPPIKLKDQACILIINEIEYSVEGKSERLKGNIKNLSLFKITQDVFIQERKTNLSLPIKLNQNTNNLKTIDFIHKNYPIKNSYNYLTINNSIYLGFPKISIYNKTINLKEFFSGNIEVFTKDNGWIDYTNQIFGKLRLKINDRNNNLIATKNLIIVPPDFAVFLNIQKKTIEFSSSKNFEIILEIDGPFKKILELQNKVELQLNESFDSQKSFLAIGIKFEFSQIINLKLPNLKLTEIFIFEDASNSQNTQFAMSNLHDLYLYVTNFNPNKIKNKYTLTLDDPFNKNNESFEVTKKIEIEPLSSIKQSLFTWKNTLDLLLSITTNTRAKINIHSKNIETTSIQISKYDFIGKHQNGTILIEGKNDDQNLELQSFRLDAPFNKSDIKSFIINKNQFEVPPELSADGIWFIYSSATSQKSVCPWVISNIENNSNVIYKRINNLHEASNFDFASRIESFKSFFDDKYKKIDDPIWKNIYEIYNYTEHLPLDALDFWKGLIKSEKGIVTFLFSEYSNSSLIRRFSKEFIFVWHLIPIQIWKEVFDYCKENVNQLFLQEYINQKLDMIKYDLGLYSLSEILYEKNMHQLNFQLLQSMMQTYINGRQGVLGIRTRQNNNTNWPTFSKNFIFTNFNMLPKNLRESIPNGLTDWEKPVIYLPLVLAFNSVKSIDTLSEISLKDKFGIKINLDFDRIYFDDVYSIIQGYYYNNLKNEF